jgi:hypothetical protein
MYLHDILQKLLYCDSIYCILVVYQLPCAYQRHQARILDFPQLGDQFAHKFYQQPQLHGAPQ